MKIATLFGTRPEIIRLSRVISVLDPLCDQAIIFTGQNSDPLLSNIFFDELCVRQPDVHLGVVATTFSSQIADIVVKSAEAFARIRPDRILLLGDTNSGLSALAAARMGIPVFHMEAGNRCYDDRVPEEVNRRVIDHCSAILMPYTERSKDNLLREGFRRERIFVTGNPIQEVLEAYSQRIDASDVLARHRLEPRAYLLATIHRAENVDIPERLASLLRGLCLVADDVKKRIIVSIHPRTAQRLAEFNLVPSSERICLVQPLGFSDFVRLEKNALCVLTDSGTVQEECAIFHVPTVTLRDVTERPETIECGSNILAGADPNRILTSARVALATSSRWLPPREYTVRDVSRTVAKIVLGHEESIAG